MAALIPLRCPSCGGNLEVPGAAAYLTCSYCQGQLVVRSQGGATFLEPDAEAIRAGVGRIESQVEGLRTLAARSEAMLHRVRAESELSRLRAESEALRQRLAGLRAGCGTVIGVVIGVSLLGSGKAAWAGALVLVVVLLAHLGGVVAPRRNLQQRLDALERRAGELAEQLEAG
jgi:uncharacterized membrane protein (Fun14 family)